MAIIKPVLSCNGFKNYNAYKTETGSKNENCYILRGVCLK